MKKTLMLIAAVAMLIPAASSCKKDRTNNSQANVPTFDVPKTKAEQGKLDFTNATLKTSEAKEIKSIDFTNKGEFIARFKGQKVNDNVVTPTPFIGTYTVQPISKAVEGNEYVLDGFGTITVVAGDNGDVTVTAVLEGMEEVTVTATSVAPVENADSPLMTAIFAKQWSVDKVTINFNGSQFGNAGISTTFDGCNIENIIKWATEHGLNIDASQVEALKGYNVKYIDLTETGTFQIAFEDRPAFVGDYSGFNLTNGTFSLDLTDSVEGIQTYVLTAKADGVLGFNAEQKLVLELKGSASYYDNTRTEQSYTVELMLVLK